MERQKRDGNHSSPQNKLIQDSEGNEKNRYPVPFSNKAKINHAKDPNEAHKNTLKEESLQVITELTDLIPPPKDTVWQTGLKRKIQQSVTYRRPISLTETSTGLGLKAGRRFTKPMAHENRQE
jgi:hypothetical protein